MSQLRFFYREVVPQFAVNVKVNGHDLTDDKEAEEKKKREEAKAREAEEKKKREEEALAAEEKAAAAAYKADIMQRLAALIAPYKEGVADGGADAKYLTAQLAKVKAAIAKHRYTDAERHLDVLEEMLDTWSAAEDGKCEHEDHVHKKDGHSRRPSKEPRSSEDYYDEEWDAVKRPRRKHVNYVEDEENGRPVKRGMGVIIDEDEIKCRERPHRNGTHVDLDDVEYERRERPRRPGSSDCGHDTPPPPVCPPKPPEQCTPPAPQPPEQCVPAPACPPQTKGNPDIVCVQEALKKAGFDPGPIDGVWGPKTRAAVIAFQKAKGLTADGVVGPKTRAALGCPCGPTLGGGGGGGGKPKPCPTPKPYPAPGQGQGQGQAQGQNQGQGQSQGQQANSQANSHANAQANPTQNTNTTTQVNPSQNTNTSVNPNQSTTVNPNQSTTVNPTITQNPNQNTTVNPTQTNSQQQSNNNNQNVVVNNTIVLPPGTVLPGQPGNTKPPEPEKKEHDANWHDGVRDVAVGALGVVIPERAAQGAVEIIEDIGEHLLPSVF